MRNNCLYGLFFFVLTIQSKSQSAPAVYGTNSFLFKSPFAVNESVVSFFLRGNLNAKKVIVTGNFTNWSTTSISMTRTDSGWIAPVKLGAGKHYYKFIIDGVWDIDNDNKNFETDPNGYINSVYYKTNTLFKLPSYSGAKAVFLCGSFNNWKENELKMQKTAKGWELPLYLSEGTFQYRFIVDGKGYTDPLNSRKTRDLQNRLCSFITVGQEKITVAKGMQLAAQYETDAVALTAEMNYTAALQRYRQAEEIYHSIKLPDSAGSVLLKSAAVYRLQADFPSQLQAIQKAIKLFEQTGTPEKLAAGYRALGSHHINLGKWSLAFEGYEKAMHLYEQVGNKMMVALTLHQMGHSCGFYDKEKSLVYLNRSLKLSEQIGYEVGIAENHWLLGFHYTGDLKDTLTALKYYAKADELYKKNNSKGGMAEIRLVLAKLYIESSDSIVKKMGINPRDRLDEAIKAEKKGLQLYSDLRSAARIQVVNMFLSETFEKAGHYDSALVYYRRWVDAQYKFYNNEKERELARIQESFRFYKLEDSLNLQRLLMEGRLQKQSLLAAQQQQQLALSNKEKELQRLAFLKSQADLQNEQLSGSKRKNS